MSPPCEWVRIRHAGNLEFLVPAGMGVLYPCPLALSRLSVTLIMPGVIPGGVVLVMWARDSASNGPVSAAAAVHPGGRVHTRPEGQTHATQAHANGMEWGGATRQGRTCRLQGVCNKQCGSPGTGDVRCWCCSIVD